MFYALVCMFTLASSSYWYCELKKGRFGRHQMVVLGDVSCPMCWLQCHCDGLRGLCEMGFWSWDVAQDLLGLLFVFFWLKEWIINAASPQPPPVRAQ